MRRYREPVTAAFVVALIASLSVHLPLYDALGSLADHFKMLAAAAQKKADASMHEPVELEFDISEPAATEKPKRVRSRKAKALTKKEQVALDKALQKAAKQQPPETDAMTKQAVQQHTVDSNVEPPPDTKFIAEKNSRVEEETVAQLRNYVRNDRKPAAGAQQDVTEATDEQGNADEQDIADAREMEGSEARTVTPEEADRKRPKQAPDADPIKRERVVRESRSGKKSPERGEQSAKETKMLTIAGPNGTFRVPAPRESGRGGGMRKKGRGPSLYPTWSQYEAAVGSERVEQARNARIRERKSRQRGLARNVRWEQFRAAIENFTPAVKPGAQTALNAAASPFATYLASIHIKIHRQFADQYIRSLPTFSASPFSDPRLMTELEIVLNRDGSIERVGVAKTSGLLPFDFGAYNSVLRGQPYPEPPPDILSGDGRVYLHWGFYRNHRQCGTFNAKPYILPNPRGTPKRKPGLQDGLRYDRVVPEDQSPTWGTDGEKG